MSDPTRKDVYRAHMIVARFNATRAALVTTALEPMTATEANTIAASLVQSEALHTIAGEMLATRESREAE